MGLFFPDDPNYFPEIRPVGFARYRQVLERDWKRLYLVGLMTLGWLIPFALGVAYALLSSSVLVLLAACLLGGLFAGPGLAGMYDMILRGLRDNCDDWWFSYKKGMKQNWRAALLPGVVTCLFLGFVIFSLALLWWSVVTPSLGTVLILSLSVLLCTAVGSVWWPQVVLFSQRPGIQLKNCVLFAIRYFKRTFGVALLQILWWAVGFLFLPWTAFLVPVLGVWYILFLSCFLLYSQLDEAFEIEKQIAEVFPEQVPVYGEGK